MTNMEWIASGKTGCAFATLFAKKPENVGWLHLTRDQFDNWDQVYADAYLISIEFPEDWTIKDVREWTLDRKSEYSKKNLFWEDNIDDECLGLRIKMYNPEIEDNNNSTSAIAWIQYFGPDSHVVTRRTPYPMIMWTRKINPLGFVKQVGWNGILHLAHGFAAHITEKMADLLWDRSYKQTAKILGHKPTHKEAAKVTWLKKDVL